MTHTWKVTLEGVCATWCMVGLVDGCVLGCFNKPSSPGWLWADVKRLKLPTLSWGAGR